MAELLALQSQQQTISPKLMQFYALLQMPGIDLHQAIARELDENPALEAVELPHCPSCPCPHYSLCNLCDLSRFPHTDHPEDPAPATLPPSDDPPPADPIDNIPSRRSLKLYLTWQMPLHVPKHLHRAARLIIDALDGDGYLRVPLDELAQGAGLSTEQVHDALMHIHQMDPPGIAARSLQECLLLQIRSSAVQSRPDPVAEQLVADAWKEITTGQYHTAARRIGVPLPQVMEAVRRIRRSLHPRPAEAFESRAVDAPLFVPPDVRLVRAEPGYPFKYRAIVPAPARLSLSISQAYLRLAKAIQKSPWILSDAERDHVINSVQRAQWFLDGLDRRAKAIRRVAERVADVQWQFIEDGPAKLLPISRLDIAADLGVHESTVGRAVSGKLVQLPSGETVPFEAFFDTAAPAKQAIREIVQQEDPAKPLKDSEIADLLHAKGLSLSRRTVAKYREALHIPSYPLRRRSSHAA
ncbi:MAG: RNA polymerase factor sigma-54 [Armatimonadota bacterium]